MNPQPPVTMMFLGSNNAHPYIKNWAREVTALGGVTPSLLKQCIHEVQSIEVCITKYRLAYSRIRLSREYLAECETCFSADSGKASYLRRNSLTRGDTPQSPPTSLLHRLQHQCIENGRKKQRQRIRGKDEQNPNAKTPEPRHGRDNAQSRPIVQNGSNGLD